MRFPARIPREDPRDDDFSDAAGMDLTVSPDNADIAETVLEARKDYLDSAREYGSDTSEADEQVREIQAAIARARRGETVTLADLHG
jgi:hypothetical protein